MANYLEQVIAETLAFVPSLLTAVAVLFILYAAQRFLERSGAGKSEFRYRRQLVLVGLSLIGLLVVILTLPIGDSLRGQLLGLIGIVLSAAIALSSTTLLGNALAGLMLRVIRNFRSGDFIRVGDHFGRVSERGLFHTEIQSEDRDLITLPNLYLVTHPVRVIRDSGTLLSATVSLGYDIPHTRVETLLMRAAEQTGLAAPFVSVIDLGDFSVTYRIAGLLEDVKELVTMRSRLRKAMLDALHSGRVEIVSPTFMNTRSFSPDQPVIPLSTPDPSVAATAHAGPESVVFDKAEDAESLERLQEKADVVAREIKDLQRAIKEGGETSSADLETRLVQRQEILDRLKIAIDLRKGES